MMGSLTVRLSMLGMIAAMSMPMAASAQIREFGAVLQDAGSSAEAQVRLTLDEGAGTFSMVLLATGFTPADIQGAEIQDALGVQVFNMLDVATIDQGGAVLSLDFFGQALPSAGFLTQLESGLLDVVVTHAQGILEGLLIEGGSGGGGGAGGGAGGGGGGGDGDGDADDGEGEGEGDGTGGNRSPQAVAVADPIVVFEGEPVTLDASGSTDADGDPLTFRWIQLAGVLAPLIGRESSVATFIAPLVDVDEVMMIFRIVVDDGRGGEGLAEVTVTVLDRPADDDAGQTPPDDGGDDLISDVLAPPPCGVCGPVGVISYFGLMLGWLGLRLSPRRRWIG